MKVVTKKGFRDYEWGGTFRYVGDEFETDAIRANNLKKSGFVDIIPETKPLLKHPEPEPMISEDHTNKPVKRPRGRKKK